MRSEEKIAAQKEKIIIIDDDSQYEENKGNMVWGIKSQFKIKVNS